VSTPGDPRYSMPPGLRLQLLVLASVLTLDIVSKLLAHILWPRVEARRWIVEPVLFVQRQQHLRAPGVSDLSAYEQIVGLLVLLVVLNLVLPRGGIPGTWRAMRVAAATFAAGFVGNTTELVVFGSATDFVGFQWRGREAVFNLADIAMAASIVALGLLSIRALWWYLKQQLWRRGT
jgi:lipoprotein signal peptidase